MKTYDFKKAISLIESNKDNLASAALGMHEDWSWTAETIWEDGTFNRQFPDNSKEIYAEYRQKRMGGMSMLSDEARKYDCILIGGLYGSDWATPTLQLVFKDGDDKMIPCYEGEDRDPIEQATLTASRQAALLGPLSGPTQDNITPLSNQ